MTVHFHLNKYYDVIKCDVILPTSHVFFSGGATELAVYVLIQQLIKVIRKVVLNEISELLYNSSEKFSELKYDLSL